MSDLALKEPVDQAARAPITKAPRKRTAAYWTRWLHVYTSMISLFLVLFFAVTGVTLNHPSWTFGASPTAQTETGTLPADLVSGATVDFLGVAQYVEAQNGASGSVVDYRADSTNGTLSFKGPGYAADLVFDVQSGDYELVSERQGLIAVMNDLHKGRDTNTSWSWVIDVSGAILALVAITGLGVQLFMRKRRTRAVAIAVVATVVSSVLILLTLA